MYVHTFDFIVCSLRGYGGCHGSQAIIGCMFLFC